MGGGPDFTGEVALMGTVMSDVSLLTAEQLSMFICSDGYCPLACPYNNDCDSDCLCELIKGRDVMVYIGHITSDSTEDMLPDMASLWVEGGLLQIINGQLSGSYIQTGEYGTWVKSLLGGEYCSNMASEPGMAIPAEFIKFDEVTVKQLPLLTDLSIAKTSDTCCYTMGEVATFSVTLTNLGPSAATSILVSDVLPASLAFEGYTADQGWYDETSGYWSVGDLPAGVSVTLSIQAKVNTVGEVCNRATVVALEQHDPVTTNNMAQVCITADAADPTEEVSLMLDEGLNLISLPLIPDETDPFIALSGVAFGGNGLVGMYNGSSPTGCWASFDPNTDSYFGCTFDWADGYGYWMDDVDPGQSLVVPGVELQGGAVIPPSYDVAGGWNLIGFKSTTAKLPSEYLAGISGKYVMVYGYDNGAFYAVGSPGHAMLQPGFGYWLAVKVGESGTIFP